MRWRRRKLKLKSEHIKLANSTRFEVSESDLPDKIGKTPDEAIKRAWKRIEKLGYTVVRKKRGNFTTTLHNYLFLDDHYDKMGPIDRASLLWHELVHADQWRKWGRLRFAYRYSRPQWRWAIETSAYRHQYRIWLYFGIPEQKVIRSIKKLPSNFAKGYKMHRIDRKQLDKETFKAMEKLGIKI